ncbi:MAG TPA: glycosyltransferase family 4 protein [Methylomirabilota bacterium]|nr:glycosyltransferase family 4 protein [Methylomirabilota bacterium]
MTPLRVIHLVANRWWTGGAEPALSLALTLKARGHHVRFGCIRGDALDARASEAGLPPLPGLSLDRTVRPWVIGADVARLRRLVRAEGTDVVHAHQTHDHWVAALALGSAPTRLVRTVHHRRAIHEGPASRWLVRRTHAFLAASGGIAEGLREAGVPETRITLSPGAVDTEHFGRAVDGGAVRAALGLGPAPVVGCVARLVPGRGHDILLHAARHLRARVPGLRVLLVGRGEGRPAIERLVAELDLGSVVVFAGYRDADLPEVLAAMDCFVLLGAGSEESCRAVLEAMAAARPVVAARVGALPDTVVHGETGWLVEPEPEEVARRVEAILTGREVARRMGEAGRRRAAEHFTPEGRALTVEAVYARALAERLP